MALPTNPANWLKPYQLAKQRGVKLQTIYRWIREGKIPATHYRRVKIVVERLEVDPSFSIEQSHH